MGFKASLRQFLFPFLLLFLGWMKAQTYLDFAAVEGVVHTDNSTRPGGGVSFADFDGDGFDDLTLATAAGEPIQFYHNTPTGLRRLEDPTGNEAEVKQILWVDYDNDGDQDLFCTSFDGPVYLYRRDGSWDFTEVTAAAGFPVITKRHYGAAWGDYDRDGWLDVYYSQRKLPGQISQSRNRMFRNLGDGTFTETTLVAGVEDPGRIPFCIGFTDYNGDRWPDLYVANDRDSRNTLLRNEANGTFSDVSEATGAGIRIDAMNMGLADFDRDGDEDIYVTNIEEGSYLLRNDNGHFTNVAPELGVAFYGVGWGGSWLDGDLDGDLDLYVSGALVGSDRISSAYFQQEEDGTFSQPAEAGFSGDTVYSWSNAIGDYNRDHLPDILVLNQSPYPSQLWSRTGAGHYLEIQLEGVLSNRDATGTLVELFRAGNYQSVYTHCGSGFLAQQSRTVRFGLGEELTVDSIHITWPTGHRDVLVNPAPDQLLRLREGATTNGTILVDADVTLTLATTEAELFFPGSTLIFPNPTRPEVGVRFEDPEAKEALILDVAGRPLLRSLLPENGRLNLSTVTPGAYWVRIRKSGSRSWSSAKLLIIQ